MLRTEPAALSLPGPFGAAGFHPRLSQRQRQACCDRSGHAALFTRRILRFLHPGKLTPGCKAQHRFAPALYWLAFRDAGLMWWQLNILFAFAVVMQVVRFLQAATVLNGVAAFTVLVGYLPLSSASYSIPGLLMLAGALLIWQVRDSLRPALFVVWLLLVALLNARHGDVMMLSGVILTLAVLFCVRGLVPTSGRRLQAGRWFAPAYALHLLCIGFLVSVL